MGDRPPASSPWPRPGGVGSAAPSPSPRRGRLPGSSPGGRPANTASGSSLLTCTSGAVGVAAARLLGPVADLGLRAAGEPAAARGRDDAPRTAPRVVLEDEAERGCGPLRPRPWRATGEGEAISPPGRLDAARNE